ncbi:MAG: type III-A CRISPR-associated protein Csm2 [Armatimonadota bacterium]
MNRPQPQKGPASQRQRKSFKELAQEWMREKKVEIRLKTAFGDDVGSAQELVNLAREVGHEAFKQGLTTNQIRNIFGIVKGWERDYLRFSGGQINQDPNPPRLRQELIMLNPKLVYAASRHDKQGTWLFVLTLQNALEEVLSKSNLREGFRRFVDFFEAILAFHKEAEVESRKRQVEGGD